MAAREEEKRFAKPVLSYWLTSLSYKINGVNLVSARMVSVIAASLSVLVTYFLGRRLFGKQVGLLSAAILPSFFLHFQIARWATTDMTLNFFILLAIYFFVKGYQDESKRTGSFTLFYFAIALGFMVKGPAALLVPGLTILVFIIFSGEWKLLGQLRLATGLLLIVAINLPWFFAMYMLHGEEFINHIMGAEIKDRLVHDTPFSLYYLGVLFRYYLPWSLFLLASLPLYFGLALWQPVNAGVGRFFIKLPENIKIAWKKLFSREDRGILFCFVWILTTLILFTLVRIEHSRYLLPTSPAIAMLIAFYFVSLLKTPTGIKRPLFLIPFWVTVLIYATLTAVLSALVFIFYNNFSVPFGIMFLPLFLAFGTSILILVYLSRQWLAVGYALAIFQLLFFASINGDAIAYFNLYPMKSFAHEINKTSEGSEKIIMIRLGNHRPRMGISTGHMTLLIHHPEELQEQLDANEKLFIVMKESDWQNDFKQFPLTLISNDTIWGKTRIDKNTWAQLINNGMKIDLKKYQEKVYLFSKTIPPEK
jgi:4-amino-4-deoxy-L-arabinose transferase-like glycosyltransferase